MNISPAAQAAFFALLAAGCAPSGPSATNAPNAPGDAGAPVETLLYRAAPTAAGPLDLSLDLYPAKAGAGRGPAVLIMHGGGFAEGSRDLAENVELATALAARGYLAASISYRLLADRPTLGERGAAYKDYIEGLGHPAVAHYAATIGDGWTSAVAAAGEDLVAALEWLARDERVDPRRIAVIGMSAGAVTATTTAYAAESFAGATEAAAIISVRGTILAPPEAPLTLSRGPPLLIAHGVEDDLVPIGEARRLYEGAKAAGIPAEFHPIRGFRHDLGGAALLSVRLDDGSPFIDRLDAFIRAAFSDPGLLEDAVCIGRGGACEEAD